MKQSMILFCFCLSVIILLTVPSIPAAQYTTVMNSYKTKVMDTQKTIDIQELQEKIQNMTPGKIQEIHFTALQQKIDEFAAQTTSTDLIYVYMIVMHLLMTVIIGKPSLFRIFLNVLSIQTLAHDIQTGESTPACASVQGYSVALLFFVFGAVLFKISQNKAFGFILGLVMYYLGSIAQLLIAGSLINT